jgi:hypothetical protein
MSKICRADSPLGNQSQEAVAQRVAVCNPDLNVSNYFKVNNKRFERGFWSLLSVVKLPPDLRQGFNTMATITFDTHKIVRKLRTAGFEEAQGESDLVTKRDISELRRDIDVRFERLDGELKLNRWMLGILIVGVMSLVLKSFFPS